MCQAAPTEAAVVVRCQLASGIAREEELRLWDDTHCSLNSVASTSTSSSSRHPTASCLELRVASSAPAGHNSQSHAWCPRVYGFTEDSQFQLDELGRHVGDVPKRELGGNEGGQDDARQNLVLEPLPDNAAAGTSARDVTYQLDEGTPVPAINGSDTRAPVVGHVHHRWKWHPIALLLVHFLFAFLFAITVLCVLHHLGVVKGSRTCCRSTSEYTPCEVWHDVRSLMSSLIGAGLCYLLAARESEDIDETGKVQIYMCML